MRRVYAWISCSLYHMMRLIMTHAWLLPALLMTASAATVVDDKFADGNRQNQDLENNSMWLFNGRTTTIRTDQAGSVTFDGTSTRRSPGGLLPLFSQAGAPILIGTG